MKRNHGYTAPETIVKKSSIDNLGIYANKKIEKGTVVVAWGGKVRTASEIRKMKLGSNYALPIYPGFFIAETTIRELDDADFVNHSCEPNCEIKNLLVMITKRNIRKGEELTCDFDHGPHVGKKTLCTCGTKKCRGTVYF